jgi:hypothetical protein
MARWSRLSYRDISDRKRAERELHEAHRQTETILQSIGDAFSALDSEWRYVYINQRGLERIEELEGEAITLEEIVGKNGFRSSSEGSPTASFTGPSTSNELSASRPARPVRASGWKCARFRLRTAASRSTAATSVTASGRRSSWSGGQSSRRRSPSSG